MTDRSYPNRPEKRSKRIAILFPVGQQRGGAEALMIHYLRFNADLGRDLFVLVFLRDGPMPDLARSLGYDVRVIVAKRLRNIFNFIHVIWQLDRLFRSEDSGPLSGAAGRRRAQSAGGCAKGL